MRRVLPQTQKASLLYGTAAKTLTTEFFRGYILNDAGKLAKSFTEWSGHEEWAGGFSPSTGRLCLSKRKLDAALKSAGLGPPPKNLLDCGESKRPDRRLVDAKDWRMSGYWIDLQALGLSVNDIEEAQRALAAKTSTSGRLERPDSDEKLNDFNVRPSLGQTSPKGGRPSQEQFLAARTSRVD